MCTAQNEGSICNKISKVQMYVKKNTNNIPDKALNFIPNTDSFVDLVLNWYVQLFGDGWIFWSAHFAEMTHSFRG